MEQPAKFEAVSIKLPEAIGGVEALSAVVGIPEWWPTGARVAVAIAHDSQGDLNDPLVERVHHALTMRKFLSVRFNFPFAEAGEPASSNSLDTLDRAFRAALSIFGRDTSAAPAHLFLGGKGIGGRVAARLATARLPIEGTFFLGFPLHAADRPETAQADDLFRIISPMMFYQGTRDRRCDLAALRGVLARIGAPTTLHVAEGADHTLRLPPPLAGEPDDAAATSAAPLSPADAVGDWIESVLQGQ